MDLLIYYGFITDNNRFDQIYLPSAYATIKFAVDRIQYPIELFKYVEDNITRKKLNLDSNDTSDDQGSNETVERTIIQWIDTILSTAYFKTCDASTSPTEGCTNQESEESWIKNKKLARESVRYFLTLFKQMKADEREFLEALRDLLREEEQQHLFSSLSNEKLWHSRLKTHVRTIKSAAVT